MNDKEIVVHIKNVYGTDKVYPACKKAHLFTDIAGTTTLRPSDLKAIQDLGYSIRVTQRHIEELTYADNLRAELDYFHRRPNKC